MKIVNGNLYLDMSECALAGMNTAYIIKANSIGSNTFTCIKDPQNKRKLLVQYEPLQAKYKAMVLSKWPNPYDEYTKTPIKEMVIKDIKAEQFYLTYRYGQNKALPSETIDKYTHAVSWLNMLISIEADKKELKAKLNITLADFWIKVFEIIKEEGIGLPSTYNAMRAKIKDYKACGYSCIINKSFGNNSALKVIDELAEAVMLEVCSAPNRDDMARSIAYNNWAVENGYKTITDRTVNHWRLNNAAFLENESKGQSHWHNRFGMVIKGKRPSAPLLLLEHDDNDIDLYYLKSKKGTTKVFSYGRFVVAVVIDTFNDYVLGWALAETYTIDLIKLAYIDAMYHIKELTGGWYLPNQIRSDRFGLDVKLTNELATFYKKIGIFTPSKVKNARGKYIEQSFGKKWHSLLANYPNYAGHNITSKSGINSDLIQQNKSLFPNEDKAPFQVAEFINNLRNLQKKPNGPSRQDEWVEAFFQSEKSKKHQIDAQQLLYIFGTEHQFKNQINDNKVQITSRGIEVTISNEYHEYMIPDDMYMQVIGKRVHVIYEPYDLSRVLITDGAGIRFISSKLTDELRMPRALADYKPGDRQRLNDMLAVKTAHVKQFTEAKEKRKKTLGINNVDAVGLLQSGNLIKGSKQKSELIYQNKILSALDSL